MPRGIYDRKRKSPPAVPQSAAGAAAVTEPSEAAHSPAACADCLWFRPEDEYVGRCHWWPKPERVHVTHFCAQWRGRM
jgi:hypothetical protein